MMKPTDFLVLFALFAAPGSAQVMDYSDCCPERDCQVSPARGVVATGSGYHILDLDLVVGADDPRVRISPDRHFHICSRASVAPSLPADLFTLALETPVLKCLLVPAMS